MEFPGSDSVIATCKDNKSAALLGLFSTTLLLGACATRSPSPPPPERVAVVDITPERRVPGPQLISHLAQTQLAITDYPIPGARQQAWRQRLRHIEALAQNGAVAEAEEAVKSLKLDVDGTAQRYFEQQARRYLEQIQQFAFLRRPQQDQLRAMVLAFETAEYRRAYLGSRTLYRELWSAQAWVTVKPGETLAMIAAKPEVFDNPNLWPLLQKANKGLVRDPRRLKGGWRLRYPVHPTLDEIFAAVKIAQP